MARWDVDNQSAYLATSDGFKMDADGVKMPTPYQLGARLKDVPRLLDELRERLAREGSLSPLLQCCEI